MDESYVSSTAHYLLAAVVVDPARTADLRDETRGLPRRGRSRFHWHSERAADRAAMVSHIAARTDLQVVVVSQPVAEARAERARARCLGALLAACVGFEPAVGHVVLESRTEVLDKRDAARIEGLKSAGRLPGLLRFSFGTKAEPLLWLPDAVAGAANAELADDPRYTARLGDRLTRVHVGAVP